MKKNKIKMSSALLALLLSLVGCNNESDNISDNNLKDDVVFVPRLDKNANVTLNVLGFFSNFEALDSLEKKFNEYYPNVHIDYQPCSGYAVIKYLDSNPNTDIFMTSSEVSNSGLVKYALDFSQEDFNLNDFDENLLKTENDASTIYSLPIGKFVTGIVTNLSILEKEKIDVPKNYNEFISCLATLKEKGYTPIQGPTEKVFSQLTYNMIATTVQSDSDLLNSLNNHNENAYQKIEKIFDKVDTIVSNGYSDSSINETYPYDNYDAAILKFFEGNVPFWVCDSEKVSGMKKRETKSEAFKKNPFKYGFSYAPLGDNGIFDYSELWYGLSINKNSANVEYAKELLRLFATKDQLNEFANTKGIPSASKKPNDLSIYSEINNSSNMDIKCVSNGTMSLSVMNLWKKCITNFSQGEYSKEEAINKFIQEFKS